MTHCRREVLQAQWMTLLDDEFVAAFAHGIVKLCLDGILRRFYPRIFTYSADYPEKCVKCKLILVYSDILQSCSCKYQIYVDTPLSSLPYSALPCSESWDDSGYETARDSCAY
jgi:hypothetical protein